MRRFISIFLMQGFFLSSVTVAQDYLKDRGTGIPTSMFGTYIDRGQLLVFPFYAYSFDHNREYQPAQLGFGLKEDFRAKYQSSEGIIFVAYGLTDWLALEFEAAYISATFEKSRQDTSAIPVEIKESGLSDAEGQLRVRWLNEKARRPEFFSYLEIAAPSQRHKVLIGVPDWDFKPGIGMTKGLSWGTLTIKTDLEYNREAKSLDLGETALEYLKQLSPSWRLFLAMEGGETGSLDEWDLVTGVQWRIADFALIKFDNAVGLSSKATDWAPQIGCMFSVPLNFRLGDRDSFTARSS